MLLTDSEPVQGGQQLMGPQPSLSGHFLVFITRCFQSRDEEVTWLLPLQRALDMCLQRWGFWTTMKARGPHKSPAVPIRVGYLPLQQHVGFCDAFTLSSKRLLRPAEKPEEHMQPGRVLFHTAATVSSSAPVPPSQPSSCSWGVLSSLRLDWLTEIESSCSGASVGTIVFPGPNVCS